MSTAANTAATQKKTGRKAGPHALPPRSLPAAPGRPRRSAALCGSPWRSGYDGTRRGTRPERRVGPTGPAGAVVTYTEATATDDVDDPADITIEYSHASGAQFPLGTTTVIVTATDTAGNTEQMPAMR